MTEQTYAFPAVQGTQAGEAYWTAQVPLRFLSRLFNGGDAELPPELRKQRQLNRRRAQRIAAYIADNPTSYVLPALTASIDGEVGFEAMPLAGTTVNTLGLLKVPADREILLNDGQHRQAGVVLALAELPQLGDETVVVVLFEDPGFARCEQRFADINSNAVKPSNSLSAAFDTRGALNQFAKELLEALPEFRRAVDLEVNSVTGASPRLWSLTAIKSFVIRTFGINEQAFEEVTETERVRMMAFAQRALELGREYMPMWRAALSRTVPAQQIRTDHVTCHKVMLDALAVALNTLWKRQDLNLEGHMASLAKLDPRKEAECWQGRCVIGGRMRPNGDGVKSSAAELLRAMGERVPGELLAVEDRLGLSQLSWVGEGDAA